LNCLSRSPSRSCSAEPTHQRKTPHPARRQFHAEENNAVHPRREHRESSRCVRCCRATLTSCFLQTEASREPRYFLAIAIQQPSKTLASTHSGNGQSPCQPSADR